MKSLLIIICFSSSVFVYGQTNSALQKGNYFKSTQEEYFNNTFRPWKYQFIKTDNFNDSAKKIGEIIFWRSSAIYDNISKKYWTPDIKFEIYLNNNYSIIKAQSDKIKLLSNCDNIKKGGDIFLIGHFILFNSSSCVNCSSSSNIDYCRNIIKRILEAVTNKETFDWNEILKQFIIEERKFKS